MLRVCLPLLGLVLSALAAPDPQMEMQIRQTLMSLTLGCQHQFSICGQQFGDALRMEGKYCEAELASKTCMRTPTPTDFILGVCSLEEYNKIEATACRTAVSTNPSPSPTPQPPNSQTPMSWTDILRVVTQFSTSCQDRFAQCFNYTGNNFSNLTFSDLDLNVDQMFQYGDLPGTREEFCCLFLAQVSCLSTIENGQVCLSQEITDLKDLTCGGGGHFATLCPDSLLDLTSPGADIIG